MDTNGTAVVRGVDAVALAMTPPFSAAIAWVGSRGAAVLEVAEQFARRALGAEDPDPTAVGRGMTAYTAGIVTGARLRGREVGLPDDGALLEAVGTAGRRGTQRVVAEHCDLASVAAAEQLCASTLGRGVSDPEGRLPKALHQLFEEGLAVGLTLAAC